MTHPYIDCARRLARAASRPSEIKEIVCEVGEGTVHRLWEPLAAKQRRPTAMPASSPRPIASPPASCAAMSGSTRSPTRRCAIRAVVALAAQGALPRSIRKIPIPNDFTGHIRAVLTDGRVIEERQPHMRGGAHEPLTRADIEEKFLLNARHGGWDDARAQRRWRCCGRCSTADRSSSLRG